MGRRENGNGSVYKLSGSRKRPWVVRLTTEWDKEAKKQTYKIVGYYETKSEAEEALEELYRNGTVTEKHNYHHERRTRLFAIWCGMKSRCCHPSNASYKWYGAKGVTVCKEWRENYKSFSRWAHENGYRDDLTLDRIDPYGNYEPANCRWATWKEQASNKRKDHPEPDSK